MGVLEDVGALLAMTEGADDESTVGALLAEISTPDCVSVGY